MPPVIVAEPLADPEELDPEIMEAGTVILPVRVPVAPLVKVMVNGATKFVPLIDVNETVALKFPLPTLFVNVAVPLSVTLEPLKGPLAVTVIVVLVDAALNAAAARTAKAQLFMNAVIWFIPPSSGETCTPAKNAIEMLPKTDL